MPRVVKTRGIILSTAVALLVLSGVGIAASRYLVTSLSQIKPSVVKQLRGATGARGTRGSQGTVGPQGSPGSPGPAGATLTHTSYVDAQMTACDSNGGSCATVTAAAPCPSGTRLVGGGWRSDPGEPFAQQSVMILANGPSADNGGWTATIVNQSNQTLSLVVTAICAS
jgi:hypothetical protein